MSGPSRRASGCVYRRGKTWHLKYSVPGRAKPVYESAGTGDEREARSLLAQRRREIAEGTWTGAKPTARTVADDWASWLETRDDVKTLADDIAAGENHILPELGKLATSDVETAHILDLIAALRRKTSKRGTPLAKNTIRNIIAKCVTFFADMEQRKRTIRSPFAGLRKSQRVRKASRHEVQGESFAVGELETLISDSRVPVDRRVFYALQFFAGLRFGESAGATWGQLRDGVLHVEWQYDHAPLKGKRSEPGAPRVAPVHSTLGAILAEWQLGGFPMLFKRAPRPDDLIAPSRSGACRSLRHMGRKLNEDLKRVGLTPRGTHALRRAFKSIAVANEAPEVWIERIIHNAAGGVAAGYLLDDLDAMRRAVERIPVRRRAVAKVLAFPIAAAAGDSRGDNRIGSSESVEEKSGVDGTRSGGPAAHSEEYGALAGPQAVGRHSKGRQKPSVRTPETQSVTHVTSAAAVAAKLAALDPAALARVLAAIERESK